MAQVQNRETQSGAPKTGSQQSWGSRLQQMNRNAEQNQEQGAVTPAYKANREEVLDLLNRALASEWGSFLQYWHHYTMASDIHGEEVKDIWKEHIEDEYKHAQLFNERINELGGVPANSPKKIDQLNPSPFEEGHDLRSMIEADLVGERATIEFYNAIVRTCGFDDNETRTIVEGILLDENDHANELANLLYQFDASTGRQIPTLHEEEVGKPEAKRGRAAA